MPRVLIIRNDIIFNKGKTIQNVIRADNAQCVLFDYTLKPFHSSSVTIALTKLGVIPMNSSEKLRDTTLHCPQCGHNIHLDIDTSEDEQDYQDECAACGSDIHIRLYREIGDDKIHVQVDADDEQYY